MRLHPLLSSDLAYRLGWTLIHALWEGALVAAVLWIVLSILRRGSAQARYLASTGAMALVVIAAVGTFYALGAAIQAPEALAIVASGTAPSDAVALVQRPASSRSRLDSTESPPDRSTHVSVPSQPPAPVIAPTALGVSVARAPLSKLIAERLELLVPWIIAIWGTGVVVLSIWNLGGWIAAQRLKVLGIRPAGAEVAALVERLARQLRISRPVRALQSMLADTPLVIGWLRPVVLIPGSVLTGLSPAQLEAVLAHELAHVRRHDYLVNLFQVVIETLLFYHPAVWWISRRIRLEREQCCDDVALTVCNDRCAYAGSLAALEEVRLNRPLAMAATGSGGAQLLMRVQRVLGVGDDVRRRGARAVAAMLVLLVAVIAAAALSSKPPETNDSWAAEHGWTAQAVTATTLEARGDGTWRNLPFTISAEEENDAEACLQLVEEKTHFRNGEDPFIGFVQSRRTKLEAILARRPGYFYAEYLLAHWWWDNADSAEVARLLEASYKHAPVVLVQQYVFADGTPLRHALVPDFEIECNRVQNHRLDPSLRLRYRDLRTDDRGCIYLPVYNTVYRIASMSFPPGYDVKSPDLGWFEASQKVGLLPPATVTALPGDFAATARPGDPPTASATLPDGSAVELLAVGHFPDAQNQWWLPDGSLTTVNYGTGAHDMFPWRAEHSRRFAFRFARPLDSNAHVRFRFSAPSMSESHYVDSSSPIPEKPYVLFTILPTHPASVSIRMGIATGDWKQLAQYGDAVTALPPGFSVSSATTPGKENSSIQVTLSHPVTDQEFRVVAIDANAQETPLAASGMTRQGELIAESFRFEHVDVAKLRPFRIESRTFQWVEFKNIALEPNRSPAQPNPKSRPVGAVAPINTPASGSKTPSTQPAASASDLATTPPAFAASVELTMNVLDAEKPPVADGTFISFEAGRVSSEPAEILAADKATGGEYHLLWNWARSQKLDAQAQLLREFGVVVGVEMYGIDMVTRQIPNASWDTISPSGIADELKKWSQDEVGYPSMKVERFPRTFAFKTRQGDLGVLQVLNFDEQKNAVTLRYKLSRAASAKLPSEAEPARTGHVRSALPAEESRVIRDLSSAGDAMGLAWYQLDPLEGYLGFALPQAEPLTVHVSQGATPEQKVAALAAAIGNRTGAKIGYRKRVEHRPCIVLKKPTTSAGIPTSKTRAGEGGDFSVILTGNDVSDEQLKKWSADLLQWGRMGRPGSRTFINLDIASYSLDAPIVGIDVNSGPIARTSYFFLRDDVWLKRTDPQYLRKLRRVLDNLQKQVGGDWQIESRDLETFTLQAEPGNASGPGGEAPATRPAGAAGHSAVPQEGVLRAELQQAIAAAAASENAFKQGLVDLSERQAAQDEVNILEAKLTGSEARVREARLDAARRHFEIAAKRYQAGVVTTLEFDEARARREVAEAELAGDPAGVARVKLAAARRRCELVSKRYNAGVSDASELASARAAVGVAEAELSEAEDRSGAAAPEQHAPATGPASPATTQPAASNPAAFGPEAPTRRKVLLVTRGDVWLETALRTMRRTTDLTVMTPEQYETGDTGGADAVIFDGYRPRKPERHSAVLYFGVVPSGSKLAETDGKGEPLVTNDAAAVTGSSDDPVVGGLTLDKLFVSRAIKLRPAAGWTTLVGSNRGPLVVAHSADGSRELVVAFDLQQSNWPLQVSFPVFIARSLDWLTGA